MSIDTPLVPGEYIDDRVPYAGRSWVVPLGHAGHRMTVVGGIDRDTWPQRAPAMHVVECSCGDSFRMSDVSIGRALSRSEAGE